MKIYLKMKTAGRRRPVLDNIPYEVPDTAGTLKGLLTALVEREVEAYNQKPREGEAGVLSFLTQEELTEQLSVGKVSFGRIYSPKKADVEKAVENALQCFRDGLVRVFWNEQEITELEEPLPIADGDVFTLIRLTFLAGRLW